VTKQPGTVRAVFDQALEIAAPAERRAYLDRACAGDAELRREVESLLAAHAGAGDFLDRPAAADSSGETSTTAEPRDHDDQLVLDFLQPSSRPGALGRLGHYEILEILGRGGFGVVFKAFDENLHRVTAVKVLGPQLLGSAAARQRFLREARNAAAVRNDHVVDIHVVEEQPIPHLVMEYVAGQTLQQKLDQGGPFNLCEVLRIGAQAAEGLEAAHRQGLIHRDVKPSNILLENGVERVKITDFGLARAADDASITQSGVVAGTPMYMAPEQAQGETIDHRADLFSLGSVLYALCTGRPPFSGSSSMAVLKRVCEETPRPIRDSNPDAPEWLCAIIARLHAKKPQDRFASARELADLLTARLSELQRGGSVRPTASPDLRRPIRRKWPWAVGAALLLAAVGVGLTAAVRLFRPAPAAPTAPGPAAPQTPAPLVLPFDAAQAQTGQEAWAKHLQAPVETTNTVGMKLRLIPPGEFFMTPQYRVRLSKPFRLSRYETTIAQFRAFVDESKYKTDAESSGLGGIVRDRNGQDSQKPEYTWRDPAVAQGDGYPVGQVSWRDADEFCKWLSRKENRTYRLPTEAEWDWACRAGSEGAYCFGDDVKELGDYAWYSDNSEGKSHPVGQKKPNAWGLYDMHGNIAEYCQDWYAEDLPTGVRTDPKGPAQSGIRVIRSYGFVDSADGLQSDSRAGYGPRGSMFHFGFRVLCELPEKGE